MRYLYTPFQKKARAQFFPGCCPQIAGAQVRAAPVVGFFLDHANYANHSATSYTAEMEYAYKMQNLSFGPDGGLTPACAAAFPATPSNCFMSPHMFAYVKTPLFVFNSRFDAWQLENILQARPGPTAGLCGSGSRDSTRILDHVGMPSSPVYVSFAVATVLGSWVKWAC